ncbi:uncharacterized protein LOC113359776 [Papaver somniferum]|uniref:uncharacterized protein LOC113359776 n=1 Tax=Papaver somniferum TaxID=3469 RepID=UPI000E6FE6C0|nr:uncharacterized protein LOC113359776 [Papaver somniferum]
MNGYSGYNQVKMKESDATKMALSTPVGNFYYVVMPFGLKNAGATYQRAMTLIFQDLNHKEMEVYVDDIIVKAKKRAEFVPNLRRVLSRCRNYGLKMNPAKCTFGVTSGKVLGFKVTKAGIEMDEDKENTIMEMSAPKNKEELQALIGKVSYVRRFIPVLDTSMASLLPLLRKGSSWVWAEEQQMAFDKIKVCLTHPHVMRPPIPGEPLYLYVANTDKAIGAVLVQDMGNDNLTPIYYISKALKDAELRYSPAEKACLPLILAAQKLRHYLLAHRTYVVASGNPIAYFSATTIPSGGMARWSVQLFEFSLQPAKPKGIRGQAIADLLAAFPGCETTSLHEDIPGEISMEEESKSWLLYFDGSSHGHKGGAGVVLITPDDELISKAFKLDFPCTNNAAEYETFLLGLKIARNLGARNVEVKGDSRFLIQQTLGEFSVKEPTLAAYRDKFQRLIEEFDNVSLAHTGRTSNRHADALTTLASSMQMINVTEETITVIKNTIPSTWFEDVIFEDADDWRRPILNDLKQQPEDRQLSWKDLSKCCEEGYEDGGAEERLLLQGEMLRLIEAAEWKEKVLGASESNYLMQYYVVDCTSEEWQGRAKLSQVCVGMHEIAGKMALFEVVVGGNCKLMSRCSLSCWSLEMMKNEADGLMLQKVVQLLQGVYKAMGTASTSIAGSKLNRNGSTIVLVYGTDANVGVIGTAGEEQGYVGGLRLV